MLHNTACSAQKLYSYSGHFVANYKHLQPALAIPDLSSDSGIVSDSFHCPTASPWPAVIQGDMKWLQHLTSSNNLEVPSSTTLSSVGSVRVPMHGQQCCSPALARSSGYDDFFASAVSVGMSCVVRVSIPHTADSSYF